MTKFKTIKGYRLAYFDNESDNPAILFIHGLPTSKELFFPLMERLGQRYRTIAVDLLNYGESEKTGRHWEHRERAENLHLFLKQLRLEKIILVAHDLGASVAMDFMKTYGGMVDKLVLMSPPVYPDFKEPSVVKIVRAPYIGPFLIALMSRLLLKKSLEKGLYRKTAYRDFLQASLESAFRDPDGRKALYLDLNWGRPFNVFADYPHVMKTISVPTLIFHGKEDPYIPYSHSLRLSTDIDGAELHLIDSAAHFLPIDAPQVLFDIMNKWLSEKIPIPLR